MKAKKVIRTSLFTIMLILHVGLVEASNNITVATIGGRLEMSDIKEKHTPQDLVNEIIKYWQNKFDKVLPNQPDLIVITEASDLAAGMSMEEQFEYYEVRKNQVFDFYSSVAKANHCYIAFGMNRQEDGNMRNSCVLLGRNGEVVGVYDKNFLPANELEIGIIPGTEMPVFECDFGRVVCAICFDLNFDELRERCAAKKPDLVIFPTLFHGGLEQSKWAYSCRSYFVSAYGGTNAPSEIRNALGEVEATSTNYFNYAVATINLDQELAHLDGNWEKLTALKRKYETEVTITDPGKLGVVMITSEKDGISALDMVEEFEIELVDEYFERSRHGRQDALNQYNNHK